MLALIPQVPIPGELAYILPFTSQTVAMKVIWASSRGIFRDRIPKQTADNLLGLGLITCLVSVILLVLSLSLVGYFERRMTPQWTFFMAITTVAYRLPESSSPNGGSEIELTTISGPHSLNDPIRERSPHVNQPTSLSSREPLPPDSRDSVEHSYSKQEIDSTV
jgi:hypothetical protein